MNFNEIGPTYVFYTDTQVNANQPQSKQPKRRRKRPRTDGLGIDRPTSHSGASLNGRVSTQPDFSQLSGVDAAAASTITIQSPQTLQIEKSYSLPTNDLVSDSPINTQSSSAPSTDWKRQMAPRACKPESKYELTEFSSKDMVHLNSVFRGKLSPDALLSNEDTPLIEDTPLMAFTRNKKLNISEKIESIKYLLKLGADPSIPNKDGITPLELSLEHGWMDISMILLYTTFDFILEKEKKDPLTIPPAPSVASKLCQIAANSRPELLELACELMTLYKDLFQTYSFKIFLMILTTNRGVDQAKKPILLTKILKTEFADDPAIKFNINTVGVYDDRTTHPKQAKRTLLGFLIEERGLGEEEKKDLAIFLINNGFNLSIKDYKKLDALAFARRKNQKYMITLLEEVLKLEPTTIAGKLKRKTVS